MDEHVRRATRTRMQARGRARYLAERIGRSLLDARTGSGLLQREAAERAGVSQSFYSRIELGRGSRASLETLAACVLACDAQLAAFVEARPGASLPRDIEHVRRQHAVITLAAQGRWQAMPERPIDPNAPRSRSVDVLLERAVAREVAVVEIVDLITDAGATFRGHADKVNALLREAGPGWTVSGLLVVRGTARNRDLVRELRAVIDARYPASSIAWLAALRSPDRPMPKADGFAWTGARTSGLRAARPR
jgi:transcriptional regulator with XRE-family HTH domain